MGLQPLSWKNVRKAGREFGLPIVWASTDNTGKVLYATLTDGRSLMIDRHTKDWIGSEIPTTSARLLRHGVEFPGDEEFLAELQRRIELLKEDS